MDTTASTVEYNEWITALAKFDNSFFYASEVWPNNYLRFLNLLELLGKWRKVTANEAEAKKESCNLLNTGKLE